MRQKRVSHCLIFLKRKMNAVIVSTLCDVKKRVKGRAKSVGHEIGVFVFSAF